MTLSPPRSRVSAHSLLGAFALVLGLLMLYGGIGHSIAVTGARMHAKRTYDYRFVSLLANGGILLYAASVHVGLSRWLARGRSWAFAWSAATTAALLIYLSLLMPLSSARAAAGPALILNGAYFAALIAVWAGSARQRRISPS